MQNKTETKQAKPLGGGGPGGMGAGEKPKNLRDSMKKLLSYTRKYKLAMILSLVLAGLSAVLTLVGPSQIQEMTNIIIDYMKTLITATGIINPNAALNLSAITTIGIFVAIIYGLSFLFGYIQNLVMVGVSQKTSKRFRSELSQKFNRLPLNYYDTNAYGDMLSRVTNDVDTISNSLSQSLSSSITSVTLFLGSLIMMFVTNWVMAFAAILSTIVGFVLMSVIMNKSQKYFKLQQSHLGKLNGHVEESYSGHNIIKSYNAENVNLKEFKQSNDNLYKTALKSQFISGLMMPIMMFIGNFAYVVVCVVGAVLAFNGHIEFGVIVAFMLYIRLFTQPLSNLAQAATSMQSALAASERVFKILEEEELSAERADVISVNNVKGDIEFKNVYFGYNPDKIVIKDFSAKVKAGQKVAIVGPTGAGKTTIVNLLMRFYEINDGDITIDGNSISKIKREDLHKQFSMVLQDTWMFEGTIKDNIRYAANGVTDSQIEDVCKQVGIHHTIKTLSNGYDTIMNENTLSDGEKQLLTIARAMVKNSNLLILDEATSSVDTRTELLINNAMDNLAKGKTAFIIAHRLSTIKNADLILVVKEGNVVEKGNHKQLLKLNGFYAQLYNSQFEN